MKVAEERTLHTTTPTDFTAVPGHGVEATVDGRAVRIGNLPFLLDGVGQGLDQLRIRGETLQAQSKTCVYVAVDGQPAGLIAIADTLKPHSREAVNSLHRMGLQVARLTGDNRRTAEAIAREVGIDRVIPEIHPEQKAAEVKKLQEEGKTVAMVGDGINDAPPWHKRTSVLPSEPAPTWRWRPPTSP